MKKHYLKTGHIKITGVTGLSRGCGVTHFLLSAAIYHSKVCNEKVAILDLSGHKDYRQAKVIFDGQKVQELTFGLAGVCVYEEGKAVPQIINEYEHLMIDFGCWEECGNEHMGLMKECSRIFVCGNYSIIHQGKELISGLRLLEGLNGEKTEEALKRTQEITFIAAFYCKKIITACKEATGSNVHYIPFEPEPLKLHTRTVVFMEKLFRNEKSRKVRIKEFKF